MRDKNIGVWLSSVMASVRGDEHFWPKLMIRAMINDDLEAFSLSLKRIKEMPKGLSTIFGGDYFSYTVLHLLASYSSGSFLGLINILDFSPELWRIKMSGNQTRKARFEYSPIEIAIHSGSKEFAAWSSSTVPLQISVDVMVKLAWDLISLSRFEEFSAMTHAMTDDDFMRYYCSPESENLLASATDHRLIELLLKRGFSWEGQTNRHEIIAQGWLRNILRLVLNPGVTYRTQSGKDFPVLVDGLFAHVSQLNFPFNHPSGFAWSELYRLSHFSNALLPQMDSNWHSPQGDNGLLFMIESNCSKNLPCLSGWKLIIHLVRSGKFDLLKKGSRGRSVEDWLRLWMDAFAPEHKLSQAFNGILEEEMSVIRAECRDWILSKIFSPPKKEVCKI